MSIATLDNWSDALEQRVRALPGVRFAEARRNSKMFMAGPLRFFVPAVPPGDRRLRQRIEAEFETFRRRVKQQEQQSHEFGTRPSDVDRMRPLDPPDTAAPPRQRTDLSIRGWAATSTRVAEVATEERLAESLRTEESPMETARAIEPEDAVHEVNPVTTEEPVATTPTRKKNTFGPCPVAGCDGVAQGRHIEMHKRNGELAKDWTARAARQAAKAEARESGGGRAAAKADTQARRAESASRDPKSALGADVRHYLDEIYKGLTDLSKSVIKDLADYADTLKTENTQLRRENSQLREAMDRFEKAFAMVKPQESSVVSKLRR